MGKVGRAATSATRKGNGPGWGGAANPRRDIPSIQNAPQFQPGVSGNPSGVIGERKARMQLRAYEVLEAAMESADERTAVFAADKALDRIEGKPAQEQKHSGDMNFTIVTGVPRADD